MLRQQLQDQAEACKTKPISGPMLEAAAQSHDAAASFPLILPTSIMIHFLPAVARLKLSHRVQILAADLILQGQTELP